MSVDCINATSDLVVVGGSNFSLGYALTGIFTSTPPLMGGAFFAVTSLLAKLAEKLFAYIFEQKGANTSSIFLGKVISYISVGAAFLGFSLILGLPFELTATLANIVVLSLFFASVSTCLSKQALT